MTNNMEEQRPLARVTFPIANVSRVTLPLDDDFSVASKASARCSVHVVLVSSAGGCEEEVL